MLGEFGVFGECRGSGNLGFLGEFRVLGCLAAISWVLRVGLGGFLRALATAGFGEVQSRGVSGFRGLGA